MPKKHQPEASGHRAPDPHVKGLQAAVVAQPITGTREVNYMPYAMSVIVSRAIPEFAGVAASSRRTASCSTPCTKWAF